MPGEGVASWHISTYRLAYSQMILNVIAVRLQLLFAIVMAIEETFVVKVALGFGSGAHD